MENKPENTKKKTEKHKNKEKIKKISLPMAKKILPIDIQDLQLKPREIRFVAAYCINWHAGKAYIAAGYKVKTMDTASKAGHRLLNSDEVRKAIQRFVLIAIQPYKDQLEYQLMQIWHKRAFYSISDFYNSDGTRKSLEEIGEWEVCIDGIKERKIGDAIKIEWQLGSRTDALREIGNLLDKIRDNSPQQLPSEARKKLDLIWNKAWDELGIKIIEKGKEN